MEEIPTKKGQEVDIRAFIGKRVLFALKRDTIENSVPENAFEGDVLRVEGGYVNMNCRLNDGKVVNEWKWAGILRIIRILGPAADPEPAVYTPPQVVTLEGQNSMYGISDMMKERAPSESLQAAAVQAVGEIREQVDEMRHELTAVRHMVGTWCENPKGDAYPSDVEQELYLESHDYLIKRIVEENVRINTALADQAKEIGMMKRAMTAKGMIA